MPKQKRSKTPKPWISWSQCETYHDCPRLYKAKYIDGLQLERTYYMRLGSAMHLAARAMNVSIRDGKEIGADDIEGIFKAAIRKEMLTAEITPDDYTEGLRGLRHLGLRLAQTAEFIHDAEAEIVIPYSQDHNVGLKVIIDRIDYMEGDGLHIVDYKNARRILSKDDLRKDRQGNIYMLAALDIVPGLKRLKFTQYMFRYNLENSVEVDPDEVQWIRGWIDEILEGIISKKFPARINRNCNLCPIRAKCAEYKRRYKSTGENILSAQAAHDELRKVEAAIKLHQSRRETLRQYLGDLANAADVVPIDDGSMGWAWKAEERRGFPADKISELFRRHGADISRYLKLDASSYEEAKKELFSILPQEKIDKFKEEASETIETRKQTKLSIVRIEAKKNEKVEASRIQSGKAIKAAKGDKS